MKPLQYVIAATVTVVVLAASLVHGYLLQPGRFRPPGLQGELQRHVIQRDGRKRSYWLYQPAAVDADAALLLALHGPFGNGHGMRELTARRLDLLADRRGLRVAYPDATADGWNACEGADVRQTREPDDVAFLLAVVADIGARTGAAPAQVHAVGFSDGGAMALRLALRTPGRLASLSMAAVRLPLDHRDRYAVLDAALPPMLLINGNADRFRHAACAGGAADDPPSNAIAALLGGGGSNPLPWPPMEQSSGAVLATQWRGRYGSLRLYTIDGGGHTLPQPYVRYPRAFGATYAGFDGIAAIAGFIAESSGGDTATAAAPSAAGVQIGTAHR